MLPNFVLLDIKEVSQRRFRYRLAGTEVSGIFCADYTGRYLDEMGLDEVFVRVIAFYSLVFNDPQPALLQGSYETQSGFTFDVARLAMPIFRPWVTGKHPLLRIRKDVRITTRPISRMKTIVCVAQFGP